MPNLCESCKALREEPTRPDVPRTIRRVALPATSAPLPRRAFRYECTQCATEWSWTIGIGWYLNSRSTPATLTGEVLGSGGAPANEAKPRADSH